MKAKKDGKIVNTKADGGFISTGFSNWRDGMKKFRLHENSECHKEAVERCIKLPQQIKDIGDMLSTVHTQEKANNRRQLLTILRSIRFLSRQGLALRGHKDEEGNFKQLLRLHGETDESILSWMEKKRGKYTSAEMQNEILQIMALRILRKVAQNVRNDIFFTIMVDEMTDKSNREQVVIVLRHVDCSLEVHEDFIGLYMVPSIDAATVTSIIEDTLVRLNLSIHNCRGQCYDGASNMSGAKRGVAANLVRKEPRAIYTHCYGHALNLAVGDAIRLRGSKATRDALDTVHEISKLVKYSPKRDVMFQNLKQEISPDTPGFRVLCPTRWTVRADSLKSVLDNYSVLQALWESAYESVTDTETRARIIGVKSQMGTFNFLFGISVGYEILKHSDNLSRVLQQEDLSAAEGQDIAAVALMTLSSLRDETAFDHLWTRLNDQLNELDISNPTLPRKRTMPSPFQVGTAPHEYPVTPRDMYRQKYYETFDLAISCIRERFDQPGYQLYRRLQDVLLKSLRGDTTVTVDLDYVLDTYNTDLDRISLIAQLQTLKTIIMERHGNPVSVSLKQIIDLLKDLSTATKSLLSNVVVLVRLILVMPATNASSERSFSALRRLKTYLRCTMDQSRLNHLMVMHVHKEETDRLDLNAVANDFISVKQRDATFGKYE